MHNVPRSGGDSENMWERFYSVNRGHVIQTQQIGREKLGYSKYILVYKTRCTNKVQLSNIHK